MYSISILFQVNFDPCRYTKLFLYQISVLLNALNTSKIVLRNLKTQYDY